MTESYSEWTKRRDEEEDARVSAALDLAIKANPDGDEGALLGLIMRQFEGRANPAVVLRVIRKRIGAAK